MKAINFSIVPGIAVIPTQVRIPRPLFQTTYLILIAILLITSTAFSQIIKPVKVNDTLPDIEIKNLIRPEAQALTTKSLYQGKTLIINFWATWCVPCVREMKQLAALAEKQQGKLQVLSVSYESKATVEKFLASQPEIAASKLRIATNDNTFSKMFFHQALPHNIWINDKGIVKAITGGEEITEVNIEKFMQNSENTLRTKQEIPFDRNKPVHIPDSLIGFRSIFIKELPGVELSGSSISPSKLGKPNMTRYFEFNSRINSMFWSAYQMPGFTPNMYLMEVLTKDSARYFWPGEGKDPSTYTGPTINEWERNARYTYEFRVPKPLPDSIFFRHVIDDLELNFEIKSYKVLKKKMCWVITYDAKKGKIKKANPADAYTVGIVGNELVISQVPLDYSLDMLAYLTYKTIRKEPFVNKTGIKGNIAIRVDLGTDPKKYGDINHIQKCLSEQLGLKFELKEILYPVLIIKDNSF